MPTAIARKGLFTRLGLSVKCRSCGGDSKSAKSSSALGSSLQPGYRLIQSSSFVLRQHLQNSLSITAFLIAVVLTSALPAQHLDARRRGQISPMSEAGVIRVRVRDHRPLDRTPGIDVEVPSRAVEAIGRQREDPARIELPRLVTFHGDPAYPRRPARIARNPGAS